MKRRLFDAMMIAGPALLIITLGLAGLTEELVRRAASKVVHWPRWENAE
jgi:hypothetical protein